MERLERAGAGQAIDPDAAELSELLDAVAKRLDVADAAEAKRLAGALRAGRVGVVEAVQALPDAALDVLASGCRTTT